MVLQRIHLSFAMPFCLGPRDEHNESRAGPVQRTRSSARSSLSTDLVVAFICLVALGRPSATAARAWEGGGVLWEKAREWQP